MMGAMAYLKKQLRGVEYNLKMYEITENYDREALSNLRRKKYAIEEAMRCIDVCSKAPTASWIVEGDMAYCSACDGDCKVPEGGMYPYCPNCGRRIVE